MISTVYIASRVQKLDLELKIIRHLLLDQSSRAARDAFGAKEADEYATGMKRYLQQKPDRDALDDLLASSVCLQELRAVARLQSAAPH